MRLKSVSENAGVSEKLKGRNRILGLTLPYREPSGRGKPFEPLLLVVTSEVLHMAKSLNPEIGVISLRVLKSEGSVGVGVGVGVGVATGVGVGVATGVGLAMVTPLFHTSFLPLFTQVYFLPA